MDGFVNYRVTAGGLLQRVQASTDPAELSEAAAEASGPSLSESLLLVQPRPRRPPVASSCLTATASLTLACAGAGILSFPWALSVSRLPAFALVGSLVLGLSAMGMLALSARADHQLLEQLPRHGHVVGHHRVPQRYQARLDLT